MNLLLLLAAVPTFLDINPSWSPDGRWLAFESRRHGEPEIYVVGVDGDGLRRLTFPGAVQTRAFARHPSWSPDGVRVLFDSDRSGNEQVYTFDVRTGATTRLTQSAAREGHAVQGADGTVWFGSDRNGNVDVWRMDADGRNARAVVASPAMEAGAKPSPDGRLIAYFAGGEKPDLFVAAADGTGARNLTSTPDAVEYELAWSPDGRQIAFYSDRTGRHEIYVVDVDGANLRQVTSSPYDDVYPVFAGDGIVFSSDRTGDFELYRMGLDGSGLTRLTFSPGRDAHAAVSPDGAWIAFQSPRDWNVPGEVDLYLMKADGSEPRRMLATPGFDGVPSWSPDGKRLAFQRGVKRGEAWSWDVLTLDVASGAVRQLTSTPDVNEQVPVFAGDDLLLFSNHMGGEDRLYRMPAAGGATTPVGSGEARVPTLSPDGRTIAFVRGGDLHVGERRVTQGLEIDSGGNWSADGRRLVFSARSRGAGEIYVVKADGSGLTRLTAGADGLREP